MRFGPFDADPASGELRRDGQPVPIQDLPFRLLLALLERPHQVVSRAELTQRLWGADTFVDAVSGLNTAVAKLREALDDDAERPTYIETVPKRGYRFVGTIDDAQPQAETRPMPARVPIAKRAATWAAAALVVVAVAAVALYSRSATQPQKRVAVVLFDNETGRPELTSLGQRLTDATVFALTAQPRLAVIGNAVILRTTRPFRDIAAIRDALAADFIVIGQVQSVDGQVLVRTHLIRASDQAHVWVQAFRMTGSEGALQTAVAERVAAAVATHALR